MEKIYSKFPVFLQQILLNIHALRLAKRRYTHLFYAKLNEYQTQEKLSGEQLLSYQIRRLKENLVDAYENTLYYKALFDRYSFDPYTIGDIDSILIFPFQSKNDIKSDIENKINHKELNIIKSHTSGTTGSGLIFPETYIAENERWAVWWRYRINHNIEMGTWCAYFGGRTIVPVNQKKGSFWRTIFTSKQVMFSMYHLNSNTVKLYIKKMNANKLEWIHGYPSTISFLASLMLEKNIKLDYRIKYITTGAENLLEYQKELIKNAFNITPIQHYGLSEPVANISECEHGKLHIDEDFSLVELIPVDNEKNKFRVIGTSFINKALFFLRYDTNDIVTYYPSDTCSCGRAGRVIRKINGRSEDFVTKKDGTKIGRLDHILKDLVNIKEAQIFQSKDYLVTFNIVKNLNYSSKDEKLLRYEIEQKLGKIDYQIKFVDSIAKTKSGKLKFVISEIK